MRSTLSLPTVHRGDAPGSGSQPVSGWHLPVNEKKAKPKVHARKHKRSKCKASSSDSAQNQILQSADGLTGTEAVNQ